MTTADQQKTEEKDGATTTAQEFTREAMSALQQENSELYQYVVERCEELEKVGIKVKSLPPNSCSAERRAHFAVILELPERFYSRVKALKAAEHLAKKIGMK